MIITLETRTADSVRTYFEKANRPEIKQVLPQKAKTVEEALADYEETLLPNATSFGQTVYVDGKYVGDVWCYCIDMDDEPNCMLSFCIFELEYWSKGIATSAVNMFIKNVVVDYRDRVEGSVSKLNTFSDGFKVIKTIIRLFKDYKPLRFFTTIALVLFVLALIFFVPVMGTYVNTGLVPNFPTLIVCGFVVIAALQCFFTGLTLSTIVAKNRQDFEFKRITVEEDLKDKLNK